MAQPTIRQDQSPLFATFPLEIRRAIYQQLWLDCGLTQHIFAIRKLSYLLSFPCILRPEDLNKEPGPQGVLDIPDDAAGARGDPEGIPEPPDSTPWCAHFVCFRSFMQKWNNSFAELYSALYRRGEGFGRPDPRGSAVLTTFLVCKRMYQEASESLFSSMRFSFTTVRAMDLFLSKVPRALVSRIQAVDITSGNMGFIVTDQSPVDSRTPAQEVHDKVRASFPKLRELRLTLHPRRRGASIPKKHELEPLYALTRELDGLRKFEVFLPTKCEDDSEVGYGEAPDSLQDAPFNVRVVPPGWHAGDDCQCFWSP